MRSIYALLLLLLAAISAAAQTTDPLRRQGESTIIAFQMADSSKYVSVCQSQSLENSYIVYRFGTSSKVELEYPKDLSNSWNEFESSYYFRGGGASNEGLDLNYIRFTSGSWEYVVYQEYSAESSTTSVGIRLTRLKDGKKYDLHGKPDTLQGSLVPLRDNDRIPKGDPPN
jgi:hypothetical protein